MVRSRYSEVIILTFDLAPRKSKVARQAGQGRGLTCYQCALNNS